jgi:hypothetical protein
MKEKFLALSIVLSSLMCCPLLLAQITGVTAGTDLTGGGTSGNVTLNLDTTQVPRLKVANTFTGNQTVKGNVTASGTVAGSEFLIGSNPFGVGTYAKQNVSLGFAGSPSTTSTSNTAVGFHALLVNTGTGGANTAIGAYTLTQNSGQLNTAVGGYSLFNNQEGYDNTAVGEQALISNTNGADNTAAGVSALASNLTGGSNTGYGEGALLSNSVGNNNTAIGYYSGNGSTTGSNNTFLGVGAGVSIDPLTNATAIGAGSVVGENNALILGATGTHSVAVGIGTSTPYPDYALDVETIKSNGVINGGVVVNGSGGNLYLGMTNTVHKFRVDLNGGVYADGGFFSSGADFAESVAVGGDRSEYEPGDVLEIDPEADRHLSRAHHAYSTAVAGIYSTKPGVLASPHSIDDPAPAEVPLAVIGLVPCKVTAENGPITRGDLLVTSSRPGYAMRGTDRSRMLGAVVGKAMESLPAGAGVIQVLVTLQ